MTFQSTLSLVDRLKHSAEAWAETNGASLARLGRAAINDSSFFNRDARPQGITTGTLERFARFLGDPANWPAGAIPGDVQSFVHIVGVAQEGAQDHVA